MDGEFFILIPWLIVPTILLALFLFSVNILTKIKEPEHKVSANAGFWAGLILFVIYIVSQFQNVKKPRFEFSSFPGLDFIPLFLGFLVGFFFLSLVRFLLPTRFVGVTTLLLSAASLIALFNFIFIESLRSTTLYTALGVALGIQIHLVLFPSSIRRLWEPIIKKEEEKSPSDKGTNG